MTNLRKILYVDEYSFSLNLIQYLSGTSPSVDFSKDPETAEKNLVKILRGECFSVDYSSNPETAENFFWTKNLREYSFVIANLDYVYKHESSILIENPHLKLVLLSESSQDNESISQDKRVLRCGYDSEMIGKFINEELDYSQLPGNQGTRPLIQFYGISS